MRRVFISYHHENDQDYKNYLIEMNEADNIFIDRSVDTDDIDDTLPAERIRQIIRDNYLRDSTVTILLCGTETRFRKHVDWELKSSMIDGSVNKRSGILVIDPPTSRNNLIHAGLSGEQERIYPDIDRSNWFSIKQMDEYRQRNPDLPERVIHNLLAPKVKMSVVPWSRIANNPENLRFLIEKTAEARKTNDYDLKLPMRMRNHNPDFQFM